MSKNTPLPMNSIVTLGYAAGLAANNAGCALGPIIMQTSSFLKNLPLTFNWQDMLYIKQSEPQLAATTVVAEINQRLAEYIETAVAQHDPFLVIGGDHSSAIGTWSGARHMLNRQGALGLIWIDAHMDSHTPSTSPSGNIHGMPLAVLLGYGDAALTELYQFKPKLQPEHICLIGVRSFEPSEAALLKKLGVKVFYMEDIQQRGLDAILQQAHTIVNTNTAGYGISIDLDAIDPTQAPAVSAPATKGIDGQALVKSLRCFNEDKRLLGVEIAEFNPNLDQHQKTEQLIAEMINAIFAHQDKDSIT